VTRLHHAGDGFVEIRRLIDDDGVFAAHFRDDAFDERLSRLLDSQRPG
jgi:hypothetical protein